MAQEELEAWEVVWEVVRNKGVGAQVLRANMPEMQFVRYGDSGTSGSCVLLVWNNDRILDGATDGAGEGAARRESGCGGR